MSPHTRIEDIKNEGVIAFLSELASMRHLSLSACSDNTIFNFMGMIFNTHGEGGQIDVDCFPFSDIVSSKIATHKGTLLYDLLQRLCPAAGSFEAYEHYSVLTLLNDTFGKMNYRDTHRRIEPSEREREINLIRQRRDNGSL